MRIFQKKPIACPSEQLHLQELSVLNHFHETVQSIMAKLTLHYQHKGFTERDLPWIMECLEGIYLNYQQAFSLIEQHGLAKHKSVRQFYQELVEGDQHFFQYLHGSLVKINYSTVNPCLNNEYPKLLRAILVILKPCGQFETLEKCLELAENFGGELLYQREVIPIINHLQSSMQALNTLLKQQQLSSVTIRKFSDILNSIKLDYVKLQCHFKQKQLASYRQDFYLLIEKAHQPLFYNLVASLESIDFSQYEDYITHTLPEFFHTICEIVTEYGEPPPMLATCYETVLSMKQHFSAFVVLQGLNLLQENYSLEVPKSRLEVLQNLEAYFSLFVPKYSEIIQTSPTLAMRYGLKLANLYSTATLASIYASASSLEDRLQWLRADIEQVFQVIKLKYGKISKISAILTLALKPLVELRDTTIKELAAQELMAQTNQLIAQKFQDLTELKVTSLTVLQRELEPIFLAYQKALASLVVGQETTLKSLNDYPMKQLLLNLLHTSTLSLSQRIIFASKLETWLLNQQKHFKFSAGQCDFKTLAKLVANQLKQDRFTDNLLKQALNLGLIKGSKAIKNNLAAGQKIFMSQLLNDEGKRLTYCLALLREPAEFDKTTTQRLSELFNSIYQYLLQEQGSSVNENGRELLSLLQNFLNQNPASEQREIPATSSQQAQILPPKTNYAMSYFSLFSTPVEFQFMNINLPVNDHQNHSSDYQPS